MPNKLYGTQATVFLVRCLCSLPHLLATCGLWRLRNGETATGACSSTQHAPRGHGHGNAHGLHLRAAAAVKEATVREHQAAVAAVHDAERVGALEVRAGVERELGRSLCFSRSEKSERDE